MIDIAICPAKQCCRVRDIDLALSEVRRVLKKDGVFYCSTLGMNGMFVAVNISTAFHNK